MWINVAFFEQYADFAALFVVSFMLTSLLVAKCVSHSSSSGLPPGPRPWPLVGNLPAVLPGRQPHQALAQLAQTYGSVMSVSLVPGVKAVVVSSVEAARELLVRNADCTSHRRLPGLLERAFSTKGSVIWENGEPWKAHRRIILKTFRTRLKTQDFEETMLSSLRHLRSALNAHEGSPCQPRQEITSAISEIICSLCFGHCLNVRNNPKVAGVMRSMHEFSRSLSGVSLAHMFPWLYDTPLYSKLRSNIGDFRGFLQDIVNEHDTLLQKDSTTSANKCEIKDITDAYLAEAVRTGSDATNASIQSGYIWRAMFDLLGAATETTSETLLWGILYVCLNPNVQDRIHAEIEENLPLCGSDDVITYKQRSMLPYAQATILELLRCACVAPLSLPRVTSQAFSASGYSIPEGTEIWVNEWAINRDERKWMSPDEFDPTRFLDDNGRVDAKKKDWIIAFGEGRRMCLGRVLAETELFVFFTNLLRWFTFRFPEHCRSLPNVNAGNFGLVYSPPSFDVIIEPRETND